MIDGRPTSSATAMMTDILRIQSVDAQLLRTLSNAEDGKQNTLEINVIHLIRADHDSNLAVRRQP